MTTFTRLLVSTALTLPMAAAPAFAQDSDQPCQELSTMIEDGVPQDASLTEEEIRTAIENEETSVCSDQLAQLEQMETDSAEASDTAEADAEASAEAEVAEREQTTVQIDEERVVEGVVRLDRTPPQVDVEQGAADVTVRNAEPEVTVQQQTPEITVRQPQATVSLEMAQPTVRIEQPAPEITITMPDPNVDVANAEPQVDVQQGEPTVSVQQAPPAVNLDLQVVNNEDATGNGVQVEDSQSGQTYAQGEAQELQPLDNAEVAVTQAEPNVTYEQASNQSGDEGDASEGSSSGGVTFESAGQPTVNYESSEPNIEFNMTGEPQVEFTQSGEPQITMQTAQSGDASDQQDGEQQQASDQSGQSAEGDESEMANAEDSEMTSDDSQSAEADASAESDNSDSGDMQSADAEQSAGEGEDMQTAGGQNDLGISVDGYEAVAAADVNREELTDSALFNANNERIGDIEEAVTNGDGIEQIVVGVGGFLGLGQRQVAVSLDELQVMRASEGDEVRVYTDMTRDEIENMEQFDG